MPRGAWWEVAWPRSVRRRRRNCCMRIRIAKRPRTKSRPIWRTKIRLGGRVLTKVCESAGSRSWRCLLQGRPQKMISEQQPGGDKGQSAKRSDSAESSRSGDRKQVEAAGEENDSSGEQGADRGACRFGEGAGARKRGDDQDAERMDEMIEHGFLVDVHGVGVEPLLERVGAECSEHHAQSHQGCADGAPHHECAGSSFTISATNDFASPKSIRVRSI